MGELVAQSSDLSTKSKKKGSSVSVKEKTLYITPETKGVDYQTTLGKILHLVNMGDVLSKIQAGTQYVVQIPAEFQKEFDAGNFFMMQNQKTGKMWPSLMKIAENGRHQVVSPLPIVEQSFVQGNPLQDIVGSYQNYLMQEQMKQLAEKMDIIIQTVARIEQGQMDDRIAKFESGRNGLITALTIKNKDAREQQINSCRAILTIAQSELGQSLKSRVDGFEPLPHKVRKLYIREVKKEGYLRGKDSEFHLIQEYYDYYLQATRFLAASFAICGEFEAAKQTFKNAENFLSIIDFSRVKTIENSHKGLTNMFYSTPVEYFVLEKKYFLKEAKTLCCLELEVSGDELLEVLGDGQAREIPESYTEQ